MVGREFRDSLHGHDKIGKEFRNVLLDCDRTGRIFREGLLGHEKTGKRFLVVTELAESSVVDVVTSGGAGVECAAHTHKRATAITGSAATEEGPPG